MVIISLSSFHQKHWFDCFFPIEIPLFHEQPLFHFKLSRAGNLTFWTFQALCSGRRARRGLLGAGNLTFLFFRPRNCVFWLVEAPRSVAAWNHCCGILAGRHLAAGDLKAAWEAKKLIFYCVLQHLSIRPPIPFESGAPGCHRLLLFTAFQRNLGRRAEPGYTSPALEKPSEPLSASTVWGMISHRKSNGNSHGSV